MAKSKVIVVLLVMTLIVSLMGVGTSFAQDGPGKFTATALTPDSTEQGSKPETVTPKAATSSTADAGMVSVIVKLNVDPVAGYQGGVPGLAATSPQATGASQLDLKAPNVQQYQAYVAGIQKDFEASTAKALTGAQITNRYDVIFGGVSMLIPADQVSALAKLPGVVAVYPDELLHLDTDTSPQFIGATTAWAQAGGQENAGEGVVVGVLDTGIWPEHPSFSDPDPSGKPYAALASWHGTTCQFGSATPGDVPFVCNNKLVGAARFMATYDAFVGTGPGEFLSARDDDGHGTHTSSTAAGNSNVAASIFGIPRGLVSGIAPRARVAMYKVCGESGCFSSDSAAAVQQAIVDGVNVINFSISGGANPYSDAVELAFLNAYDAGVFVAASAGNAGPGADTTDHRGPWVTTVAASTHNRAFQTTATVTGGGASLALAGASLTHGVTTPTALVVAGDAPYNDPFCLNASYAPGTFAGKVVVCERGGGGLGRASKGLYVLNGGAVGMLLYNNAPNVTDEETDNHYLPAVHIQYDQGQALLSFLAAHPDATVTWPDGAKVAAQGDVMASFSSRGGPGQSLGVSKPDITAPGVQILAGASPQHVGIPSGPQGELFQAIAGTSMSSPHIAGSGALLKSLHPDWTPGQIKSAIMLSAKIDVVKEDGVTPATPFDDGSGRVNLSKAGKIGLTIDETAANYVADQSHLWDANYPSLYVPVMPGKVTVQRTVHNESRWPQVWWLTPSTPADVSVDVPHFLFLRGNGTATFKITVDARFVPLGEVRHASVEFRNGYDTLHFPITLVRNQPTVTLSKTCDPASIKKNATTTCTITATNTSFSVANVNLIDRLPEQLELKQVTGGTGQGNTAKFSGALQGAQPPDISIGPGASPAGGYLPLSLFGITPVSGVGDDTITNFNVPAFTYAGETYTRLGVGSNGYLVVGGGSGPDISINNQNFPDSTRPNNVLAAFWSDLNPAAGGAIRVATLTDGVDTWIVVDWNAVKEFSSAATNTFEIWIGINGDANPAQDISYAYGPVQGNGDLGFMTVGAENRLGNRGAVTYYNGTGTLPGDGTQLVVTGTAPAPGETHVLTLTAKGDKRGDWTNCAQLTGDIFFGTNIACFSGQVTR
jgi:subtilisin family serine protease